MFSPRGVGPYLIPCLPFLSDSMCIFLYSLDWEESANLQFVFNQNWSTHRCIFYVFMGASDINIHLLCHFDHLSGRFYYCWFYFYYWLCVCSNLKDCMFLGICQFLIGCSFIGIQLFIVIAYDPLYFCGIDCNFFFISDFICLGSLL